VHGDETRTVANDILRRKAVSLCEGDDLPGRRVVDLERLGHLA
jgi:hypothetical protein